MNTILNAAWQQQVSVLEVGMTLIKFTPTSKVQE